MNPLARFALALLACGGLAAEQPASAACAMSDPELGATAESKALQEQIHSTYKGDKPYSGERYAAQVGFILGQQSRYLGPRRERRDLFDCLFAFHHKFVATLGLAYKTDPRELDRLFQGAIYGTLSDAELRAHYVDPARKFPPIFDMGIAGVWRNQRQFEVGMVLEEIDEQTYRCRSFGPPGWAEAKDCTVMKAGANDYVMSFLVPPSGKITTPQPARIPLHLDGDRLMSPAPGHSLIYVRDRSGTGG